MGRRRVENEMLYDDTWVEKQALKMEDAPTRLAVRAPKVEA